MTKLLRMTDWICIGREWECSHVCDLGPPKPSCGDNLSPGDNVGLRLDEKIGFTEQSRRGAQHADH